MRFKAIANNIIHITFDDLKTLASAMCRFQEYYESPFPEIRGKIFTLGQLKAAGSRTLPGVHTYSGGNHYIADWSGFNVPSYCFKPFIQGLFDPLTSLEQDIVEALRCKQGKYYVIATCDEDGKEDPFDCVDHEICHALYYINEKYKKEVDKVLKRYDLSGLKEVLKEWGYADDVLDDECHAYLSADYDWLFNDKSEDMEKHDVKINKNAHYALRRLKKKYFKEKKK